MKLKWRIALVVAVCALALAGAYAFRSAQGRRHCWEQSQVVASLGGDPAAFDALRPLKERGVAMIELFLQTNRQFSVAQIEQAVAGLGSTNEATRRLALAQLVLAPATATNLLRACCERCPPDGELHHRLSSLLASRARLHKQISGQLTGLYSENFSRLFKDRRAALKRDCQNVSAQLFFAYAPFDQVWAMLRDGPPETRLRFLLLRLFAERDGPALELLERFSSAEVLREAARTWWPVELEPPPSEGGGHVLRAAAVKGNAAFHLLRVSLRPAVSPNFRAEWATLDRWGRWTWIYRFEEPVLGWQAVAYSEGEAKGVNQSGRPGIKERPEQGEGSLWLPDPAEGPDPALAGPGHCELPRLVPESARLPKVALTRQEALHWQSGIVYEWARPLFPASIQAHLRFSPNEHPVPRIVTDSDPPTKATRGKRTRKKP